MYVHQGLLHDTTEYPESRCRLYGRSLGADSPASLHTQLSTLYVRHCLGVTLIAPTSATLPRDYIAVRLPIPGRRIAM